MFPSRAFTASCLVVATAALFLAAPASALGTVVFSDDFEAAALGPQWAAAACLDAGCLYTIPASGCTSAVFCGSQILGRVGVESSSGTGGASLFLTGLPAHSAIELSFDFLAINSWDGNIACCGVPGPDEFEIWLDGTKVYETSFSTVDEFAWGQSYPATLWGATNPAYTGAFEVDTLGSCCTHFGNAVWRFPNADTTFVFPHTGPDARIDFVNGAGQGCIDECMGLDNLVVTTDSSPVPVPELGTFALVGAGLATIGAIAAVRSRKG